MHARLLLDDGGVLWYCDAVQLVRAVHKRSDVAVGDCDWNCSAVQLVAYVHARSLVGVCVWLWYCDAVQLLSALHTVFVDPAHAVAMNCQAASHCVHALQVVLAATLHGDAVYAPAPHTPQLLHCRSLVAVGAAV